ncbi:deoxyribodipyrimidine photo-lyase [Verrucomicrobium spinosum]|uniref:deoxyribodipyrimidine photo-lyase n=1 Tax=Verrucomicrobium spinosum TaxID=2736 RepID=UPI000AD11B63|nr:deoxyribodipyrimidine photo-lyase [Verrucomicrobium spinosum]
MLTKTPVSLHWFRRDLRLTDNTALHAAQTASTQVIPFYVLSSWKKAHAWTGPNRQHFLCGNLESLAKNLEAIGSRLIIRSGETVSEIERLIRETGATALYTNRDPDPYGQTIETHVIALCNKLGVAFHTCKDAVLHQPQEVLTGNGGPYRSSLLIPKTGCRFPKPSLSARYAPWETHPRRRSRASPSPQWFTGTCQSRPPPCPPPAKKPLATG